MGAAKPTLGYISRTEAVLALRAIGHTTAQIADEIGISHATVTALEHSAGRARQRPKRQSEENGRTILFPLRLINRLGPHAAKRGIHPNHLARMLVEVAVDDDLIDSILDDAEVEYD